MKKESSNKLKCQITGNERISNTTYLTDKAYKYGVSVTEWKAFYVSKPALGPLKAFIASFDVVNAAVEYNRTEEDIKKMVSYNGGGGFLLRLAEQEVKGLEKAASQVQVSVEDAAVALELATAEIERTKEMLVEKNQTSDADKKNARRRELYAEKKRQVLEVA
jgi:hypothetical protein|tara:strand:+ start:412 stop:900 length:489 start_codon:yes stop_codon:yes gene_type:complete